MKHTTDCAVAVGFALLAWGNAGAFDCAKAKTASELAICSDETLRSKDEALSAAFRDLQASLSTDEAQALKTDQRSWISDRDKECPAKAVPSLGACLASAYDRRLADLGWLAACAGSGAAGDHGCGVHGTWRVTKVLTADSGVQAVDPEDPALLALTLQEQQGRLRLGDEVCGAPSFRPQLRSATIWFAEAFDSPASSFGWPAGPTQRLRQLRLGCAGGATLGPEAIAPTVFNVRSDGQLGLRYYDGAFLILRRP